MSRAPGRLRHDNVRIWGLLERTSTSALRSRASKAAIPPGAPSSPLLRGVSDDAASPVGPAFETLHTSRLLLSGLNKLTRHGQNRARGLCWAQRGMQVGALQSGNWPATSLRFCGCVII